MTVDSTLALFTTLFGWQFYNVIWDVLTATGIAFLPFFFVLLQTFIDVRTEGDFTRSAPDVLITRLETKFFLMFIVIVLAAQPSQFTRLSPGTIQYMPHQTWDDPSPPVAETIADSNSTFGTSEGGFDCFATDSCGLGGGVNVPVWWFAAMAVSQGVNRAILAEMPEITDLRSFIKSVQYMNIDDPALRVESSLFYTECFLPARGQFLEDRPFFVSANDVDWLGGRYLVRNYYPSIRAKSIVNDFAFDASRDTEWAAPPSHGSGKPNCDQWWNGAGLKADGRGLREKLLNQTQVHGQSLIDNFGAALRSFTREDFENALIERMLQNSPPAFSNEDFQLAERETSLEAVDRSITTWFSGKWAYLTEGSKYDVILFSSPMVQALLLMGVYIFLPFALLASRYSPTFLVTGAFVIFTMMFWTTIWYIVTWVDDQLIRSIFPDDRYFIEGYSSGPAKAPIWSAKHDYLNFLVVSMNVVFPLLFSTVMGWAGYSAASTVGRLADSSGSQKSIAGSAGNTGAAVAKTATSAGSKALAKKA